MKGKVVNDFDKTSDVDPIVIACEISYNRQLPRETSTRNQNFVEILDRGLISI